MRRRGYCGSDFALMMRVCQGRLPRTGTTYCANQSRLNRVSADVPKAADASHPFAKTVNALAMTTPTPWRAWMPSSHSEPCPPAGNQFSHSCLRSDSSTGHPDWQCDGVRIEINERMAPLLLSTQIALDTPVGKWKPLNLCRKLRQTGRRIRPLGCCRSRMPWDLTVLSW